MVPNQFAIQVRCVYIVYFGATKRKQPFVFNQIYLSKNQLENSFK